MNDPALHDDDHSASREIPADPASISRLQRMLLLVGGLVLVRAGMSYLHGTLSARLTDLGFAAGWRAVRMLPEPAARRGHQPRRRA